MPDYSGTTANHPVSAPDTLVPDKTHDEAADRDAANPVEWAGAHAERVVNELRALSLDVREMLGLAVRDNAGIEVAFTAGRIRTGDGAPVDVAAGTLGLTDDDTNYVEVTIAGAVSANVTAFTAGRVPLATVVCASGDISSVTDDRSTFVAIGGFLRKVGLSVAAEAGDEIAVTVQIQNIDGTAIAENYLIHAWLSDAVNTGETAATPDGGATWSTGVTLETITAGERWTVITDGSGTAVLDVAESGVDTWYLVVEIAGKIYNSAAITFA